MMVFGGIILEGFQGEDMTKAIIYVRVSSKEQAEEGYSIESQQKYLRQYALEKDLEIIREFIEVESAKASGRPAFNEMIAFLRRNKSIKTILCEKTDRIYRNFTDYVALDIDQQDLTLILAKEGETISRESKSHQKLVHGLKVLLAKNYIDNLKEESAKGLLEKAQQGEFPQKAPTGYRNNKETKLIEVDRERAPLIEKLFELYATGNYSLEVSRKKIIQDGLSSVSGKTLSKSQVEWILKNPIYYGYFRWRGQLYKGVHEPIISKRLFDQVQEQFDSFNRPKQHKHDFAYTGLIRCAKCGCAITAEMKKGKYVYYHCTGFKGNCEKPHINQEDLEKKLGELVQQVTMDDKRFAWCKKGLTESHEQEKEYHNSTVEALNQELKQLQAWTDKAYQDKLQGVISEDYWRKVSTEWTARQASLLDSLNRHKIANRSYLETGIRILGLANKAYDLFQVLEPIGKRELLNDLLSNCVWDGKKLYPTYKKPFDILAKGFNCSNQLRD